MMWYNGNYRIETPALLDTTERMSVRKYTMDSIPHKICSKCKADKPLTAFAFDKSRIDGHTYVCKECVSAFQSVDYEELKNKRRRKALGLKVCPMCKQEKPFSEFHKNKAHSNDVDPYCKQCSSERKAQHRIENPEPYKIRALTYYWGNRDELREKAHAKYTLNPLPFLIRGRKAYEKNKPKIQASHRVYYLTHKPEHNARINKRRSLMIQAEGTHTADELKELYEPQDARCGYCGMPLFGDVHRDTHIDHMIPLSRGGTNWIENMLYACEPCNLSKNTKTPDEWKAVRGW